MSLVSSFAQDCLSSPAGLVGWWTGDNHASDLAGMRNHGTAQSLNYGPGKVGAAFQFRGASSGGGTSGGGYGGYATGSAVAIAPAPELAVKSLTFAAWINPSTEDYRPIVMYQRDGDYAGALFWTGYWPGHTTLRTLYANLREGPGIESVIQAADVIFTNRWTFVAVTYEQTNGVARLMVDDRIVKEENVGFRNPNTSGPLYIGHCPPTTLDLLGGRSFEGRLDEVQVFNRALSTAELNAIFFGGSA